MIGNFQRRQKLLALIVFIAAGFGLHAHRLDECLQAALIEIKSEEIGIRLYLTPGVEVAAAMLRLIDRDGDGKISDDEAAAYGKALLADLSVRLDDRGLKLELLRTSFDPVADLKEGAGNIRLELRALTGKPAAGNHTLSFENQHQPKTSVYLVNALLPKDTAIKVLKQERNENQSIGQIFFSVTT